MSLPDILGASMGRTCPFCSSSEIDEDPSRGDATCMNCGTVLEESRIVSDVQFQETSGGGHEVIGQFVSSERSGGGIGGVPGVVKSESRELTFYKGKKLIQEVASQLRINNHCVNTAYNFFKMCVSRNFTRGRVRSHVVAACLYMTCRLENTSHLLLDFSDVTQVNVFDLGRTLNFLTRSLKINLPTTDPCLYVLRFAIILDLKEKQKEIVSLATRIVQRMKRDWMSTGRRPTGICGAALLLACRALNVNRSIADIVRVVHISETVVRKRLDEFASTPSGSLTIDEFHVVDLEESQDPPSFQAAKMKTKEMAKKQEEEMRAEAVTKDFDNIHKEVEEALKQKMKRSPYAKYVVGEFKDASVPELSNAATVIQSELLDTVYKMAEDSEMSFDDFQSRQGPSLRSLGIISESVPSTSAQTPVENDNGELDLDGIDDDEIESYILSNEEAELKSEVWMMRNGIHLEEMERKRLARLEEEERERENPKKKRKVVNKKLPINASNHTEAMLQVIQEKKLSNKINYDILKEIEALTPPNTEAPLSVVTKLEVNNRSMDSLSSTHTESVASNTPCTNTPTSEDPPNTDSQPQVEENTTEKEPTPAPAPKQAPSKPTQSRYRRNMIRPKGPTAR
uniref:B-related factor 1 n=2 Tax=Bursaphelenchus xylophilus TaxID=6326 RepID=A0A1I7RPR5_BURXY